MAKIIDYTKKGQDRRARRRASRSTQQEDAEPGVSSTGQQGDQPATTEEEIIDSPILEGSGGTEVGSGQTEVIGDDPAEELVKVSTTYLREVPLALISEEGFITNLSFIFQQGVETTEFSSRVKDSVIIQRERYAGEGRVVHDYTSLSVMDPFTIKRRTGRTDTNNGLDQIYYTTYSVAEKDSLSKFIGGGIGNEDFFRMTSEDVTQKIISLFDFYNTDFDIETSIFNNSYTMDKKITLSAVSQDLIDIGRRDPIADLYVPIADDASAIQLEELSSSPSGGSAPLLTTTLTPTPTPARQGPAAPTTSGKAPIQRSSARGASYQSAGKPSSNNGSSY